MQLAVISLPTAVKSEFHDEHLNPSFDPVDGRDLTGDAAQPEEAEGQCPLEVAFRPKAEARFSGTISRFRLPRVRSQLSLQVLIAYQAIGSTSMSPKWAPKWTPVLGPERILLVSVRTPLEARPWFGKGLFTLAWTDQPMKTRYRLIERRNRLGALVFMNPPYGSEIARWKKRVHEASIHERATVVCLVPERTDTRWRHRYAMRHEMRFLPGRLRFGTSEQSAPFPSAFVVMRPTAFRLLAQETSSKSQGAG
jgi:hypothetical protein